MKFIFSLLLVFAGSMLHAQVKIELAEAEKHVGDSVVLTGKVWDTRYLSNAGGAPTLINLGAGFPNQLLTVVIFGEDRKNFSEPETEFRDKTVKVTGRITLYKGKPQIVVHNREQFSIVPASGQ
jgi:DNA/RNA endonuclease YhcR with UshA esterase domain